MLNDIQLSRDHVKRTFSIAIQRVRLYQSCLGNTTAVDKLRGEEEEPLLAMLIEAVMEHIGVVNDVAPTGIAAASRARRAART